MESKRSHEFLRWNNEVNQWFCIQCGRTSDHHELRDAKVEIEQHDCEMPYVNPSLPR